MQYVIRNMDDGAFYAGTLPSPHDVQRSVIQWSTQRAAARRYSYPAAHSHVDSIQAHDASYDRLRVEEA